MKILVSGLSAAVLMLSASPGWASPAPSPAPAAQTPAQAAQLQDWMQAVAIWSQGFQTFGERRISTMNWLLESADVLAEQLETGGPEGARSWASQWAIEARARLAADMESYAAVAGEAPRYPANLPRDPEIQSAISVLSKASESMGSMVITSNYASSTYIDVLERAASGEEADLKALDGGRASLMIAQLSSENAMLEGATATGGPTGYLMRLHVTSNRCLMAYFEHKRRTFTDDAPDAQGAVQAMHAEATQARNEVIGLRREIAKMRTDLRLSPDELKNSPLGVMMGQLIGLLDRSVEEEIKVADALDQLAETVAKDDLEAEDAAWDLLHAGITERAALRQARRELMAQGG